jgi:hypothetical protein
VYFVYDQTYTYQRAKGFHTLARAYHHTQYIVRVPALLLAFTFVLVHRLIPATL